VPEDAEFIVGISKVDHENAGLVAELVAELGSVRTIVINHFDQP